MLDLLFLGTSGFSTVMGKNQDTCILTLNATEISEKRNIIIGVEGCFFSWLTGGIP